MGKSKGKSTTMATTTTAMNSNLSSSFPNFILIPKSVQPSTLIPTQVTLLPNLLSSKECSQLIQHFSSDKYSLIPSPQPKKGEALRTNSRIGFQDPSFAKKLWEESGLKDLVADWESLDGRKKPMGLNGNIRIYRYLPGELFGPHYDESTKDESSGLFSEWTLLIYLTGKEDGVKGGETVFFDNHSVKGKQTVAPLERGMGLLHRHGQACMLHEGRPPISGAKWILRSDLLFG